MPDSESPSSNVPLARSATNPSTSPNSAFTGSCTRSQDQSVLPGASTQCSVCDTASHTGDSPSSFFTAATSSAQSFAGPGGLASKPKMRAKASACSDAPPTRHPSTSGHRMSSSTESGLTEPPYWMTTASAAASPKVARVQPRMNACTDCAMAGVAVRPVPMAHTGSYAITTLPEAISSAETFCSAPASCSPHTSRTRPPSYCSLLSPMHTTATSPASRMARVLRPTSSSVSPNSSRRSEWPTSACVAPTDAAMLRDVSPVYAPSLAK